MAASTRSKIDAGGETVHLRLISKNHSSFCTFFAIWILCTVYFNPSSSSVQLIFWPLGVPDVYLCPK